MTWSQLFDNATRVLKQDLSLVPRLNHLIARALKGLEQAENREAFLDEIFDFTFPDDAPFCKEYGLSRAALIYNDIPRGLLPSGIPNGLAFELYKFYTKKGFSPKVLIVWLETLCPGILLKEGTLKRKITATKEDLLSQPHKRGRQQWVTTIHTP